ncbi:hypothetical protein BALOs_1416 [Halobacteriovorax sp. BALOs_7]|nr:hypothetical protein BALOs_1416 [Halobacteriovorax sp. BALOs_7]
MYVPNYQYLSNISVSLKDLLGLHRESTILFDGGQKLDESWPFD